MIKCEVNGCENVVAVKIVNYKHEDIFAYSCKEHVDEVFDMVEDLGLVRLIEGRLANDNGVRYTLNDLRLRNEERHNKNIIE